MGIFTNVQFSFIFEWGSIISSLLWEIKYWFLLLPRPVRISLIWFTQKPAREFFCSSLNLYNLVWAAGYSWVFRDEDTGAKCVDQCELAYIDCTLACSDSNCLMECGRTLTECVNSKDIYQFFISYKLRRSFHHKYIIFKIVHVMSTVPMVAMAAQIRSVFVAKINRLKMKKT